MTVRLEDRFAQVMAICGPVVIIAVVVSYGIRGLNGSPLGIVIGAILLLWFGFVTWQYIDQARSVLIVADDTLGRSGRFGWRLPRAEIEDLRLVTGSGGRNTYLAIQVSSAGTTRQGINRAMTVSRWFQRQRVARNTILLRIRNAEVAGLTRRLDSDSG